MTPTRVLIISEYDYAWWKRISNFVPPCFWGDDVLVFHPPDDCLCSPRYEFVQEILSNGYESVEDYLRQYMDELRQYADERKKVSETVEGILKDENIDWSLGDGNRDSQYGVPADMDAWYLWLEEGRGKIFKAAPLPPSAFIDAHHFWDFIYEGGDCYAMEPFEESSLTDEQALKILLVLEVTVSTKGLCWFYRALRDRFGLPWGGSDQCDCDMFELNEKFIRMIVENHKNKPEPLRLTCEAE